MPRRSSVSITPMQRMLSGKVLRMAVEWQPLRNPPEPRSAYLQDVLSTVEPPAAES